MGIDRQAELLGHAVPLGVAGPPAVFRTRGLALACYGALELAVETHTADGGPLLDQASVLLPAGPIDGRVVRGFGGPGTCEPDLLAGIDSPLGGQLPGLGHAFPREGQHLERVAVGSSGSGFLGEPSRIQAFTARRVV